MNVAEAKSELKRLLSRLRPAELTQLLGWMKNSGKHAARVAWASWNEAVLVETGLSFMMLMERGVVMMRMTRKLWYVFQMQRRSRPTVHVDGFLYDDEQVDSLCERGLMSRNYCLSCGSHRTAPLGGSTSPLLTFVQVYMFSSSGPAVDDSGEGVSGQQALNVAAPPVRGEAAVALAEAVPPARGETALSKENAAPSVRGEVGVSPADATALVWSEVSDCMTTTKPTERLDLRLVSRIMPVFILKGKSLTIFYMRAKGALVRARFTRLQDMDAPTTFFFNLGKSVVHRKQMVCLQLSDGRVTTDPAEMRRHAVAFYTDLFSADGCDVDSASDLLQGLHLLSPGDLDVLNRDMTLDELSAAVSQKASGKAPGIDGLPSGFFKHFWSLLGRDLLDVFKECFVGGILAASCRRAVISLIPKKGDLTLLRNWRPAALLCADYKILSKVLSNRLKMVIDLLIGLDQSYCIPDQSVIDNLFLMRDVFDICEVYNAKVGIVSLDQEKAFDRVDHDFLFSTLETFGVGRGFLTWVKLLYSDACCVVKRTLERLSFFLISGAVQTCRRIFQEHEQTLRLFLFHLCVCVCVCVCVCIQGYVYSSASRLLGLEISEGFVRLQDSMLHKYKLTDRVQVLQADVCTQDVLLQNADVVVMNNVFEYFMEPEQQVRAWKFIVQNFRKKGSLLVTVPSLHESLNPLQEVLQPDWVEELPINYDVYLGRDTDPDALRQIHLYRVI
nr:PREDICTED: uncharacterized protein LOC102205492 [Pundamilia nyererei]